MKINIEYCRSQSIVWKASRGQRSSSDPFCGDLRSINHVLSSYIMQSVFVKYYKILKWFLIVRYIMNIHNLLIVRILTKSIQRGSYSALRGHDYYGENVHLHLYLEVTWALVRRCTIYVSHNALTSGFYFMRIKHFGYKYEFPFLISFFFLEQATLKNEENERETSSSNLA